MRSVLSYFDDYFNPNYQAQFAYHSAGWIARHLYSVLSEYGPVDYIDGKDRPTNLKADLFIGHFWNFSEQCHLNDFGLKAAVYSIANPDWTRAYLTPLAERYSVPFPEWDFPPDGFDNQKTFGSCDDILLIGNDSIANTFPDEIRNKIQLLNYSVNRQHFRFNSLDQKTNDFCYVATQCDLRKGFMDVLRAWSGLSHDGSTLHGANLHIIGEMRPAWERLFRQFKLDQRQLHVQHHGWVDSSSQAYVDILHSCRFAYIPTYSEGQMGTLLEAIFCGCIPITSRMSGIDQRVLQHCIIIEPENIDQQISVLTEAAQWSNEKWQAKLERIMQAAKQYQTEEYFSQALRTFIETRPLKQANKSAKISANNQQVIFHSNQPRSYLS